MAGAGLGRVNLELIVELTQSTLQRISDLEDVATRMLRHSSDTEQAIQNFGPEIPVRFMDWHKSLSAMKEELVGARNQLQQIEERARKMIADARN